MSEKIDLSDCKAMHRAHRLQRLTATSGDTDGSALFIPLKREYYERFRDGKKTVEFRPFGPRWNFRTCQVGRRVVLSLGYGKKHRMVGTIQGLRIADESERDEIPGWRECYGNDPRPIACIGIYLDYDARVAGGYRPNTEVCHAAGDARPLDPRKNNL